MQCPRVPEPKFEFRYPRKCSGTRLPEIPDPALVQMRFQLTDEKNKITDFIIINK